MRSAVIVVALTASALGAGSAKADDRATAQELFTQGKALIAAGDVPQACSKLAVRESF